ncbi:Uncharacterised protein [Nocardia otitidiscaviarum]|uniref:4Fe-4S Wbl-type domain-containing protein n=2 Tax=Nocardia otitidiscaviarum TaxID=1823 RepID=A0A378Y6E6_9NOCA|nr:hypothetical protein [Nocardia otitidiscaviarum]SUA72782.1 Uncharacterised protein [Nocardia otitidiscaviarum]
MTVTQNRSLDRDTHAENKSIPRPPCAQHPDGWDLDTGTPDAWRQAVAACHACPLFVQCQRMATALVEAGEGPRAMIWAGVGYDNSGKVIPNLDRHRIAPVDRQRPTRIVRTQTVCKKGSGEPLTTARTVSRTPRGGIQRQIVLGRSVIRCSDGE